MSNASITPPPARRSFGALANTLIVAAGYLLSRLLGLLRDIIIAGQFGTAASLDAYRASFGIIDMIYIVVAGGALSSAFIPVFAGLLAERRNDDAWRLASGLLRLAFAGLLVACLLIGALAEPLVALTVGRGFDPAKRALTVDLLRLMLLQPCLLGLGGLAKATLESFDQFTLPAVGSNLYNLGLIGGALLAPWLGIYGLVWGVNLGAALFLLVQLPGLRAVGARYLASDRQRTTDDRRPTTDDRRPTTDDGHSLGTVLRLLGPRLFGQAAWQINLIAITSFASTLGNGPVAANGYALQLMLLPHGLLALSLGTVLFPQLARAYAAGDHALFRQQALAALRAVLFLALLAAALLGVLALPIVQALFQRGSFDAESARLASSALTFYALGLAGFAAAEIVVRSFYARHDTRTPVAVGVLMVLLNIVLGWWFLRQGLGLGGLALAFSLSSAVEFVLLLVLLGRQIGGLLGLWGVLARMLLAALLSAALLFWLYTNSIAWLAFLQPANYRWPADFLPLLGWLALAGSLGVLVYAAASVLLGVPEFAALLKRLRRTDD